MEPRIVVMETLCMIFRYSYYVHGKRLCGDVFYDKLEREVLPFLGKTSPLHLPGSSLEADYKPLTIEWSKGGQEFLNILLEKVYPDLDMDFYWMGYDDLC